MNFKNILKSKYLLIKTSKAVNASLMERHKNSQLSNVFPTADEVGDLSCEVIVTNPPENLRDTETQSLLFLEKNHKIAVFE